MYIKQFLTNFHRNDSTPTTFHLRFPTVTDIDRQTDKLFSYSQTAGDILKIHTKNVENELPCVAPKCDNRKICKCLWVLTA